jgi:hypothetical protein
MYEERRLPARKSPDEDLNNGHKIGDVLISQSFSDVINNHLSKITRLVF